MFMRNSLAVVFVLALAAATAVAADQPGLGKPVIEADLALWDITIGPDVVKAVTGVAVMPVGRILIAAVEQVVSKEEMVHPFR